MDKMLQAFKKHLNGLDNIDEIMQSAPRYSKMQTHEFGEGIKGVNEFVGCIQILDSKLTKLQVLISKIEFSIEDVKRNFDSATMNMSEILISQAKELIANTKFIDKELFDCALNASMRGFDISFEIQNPSNLIDEHKFKELNGYIESKKDEIKACLEVVRALTTSSDEGTLDNFRGKTIKEVLSML